MQSSILSPLRILQIISQLDYNAFYIILQQCLPFLAFMDNPVNPNCQIFCILTLGSSSSMLLRPFGGYLTHLYDQSLTVHSTTRRSYFSRTLSTLHSLCGTLHITTQFFSMLLFAVLTYVLCFPLNKQHMTNPTLSFA